MQTPKSKMVGVVLRRFKALRWEGILKVPGDLTEEELDRVVSELGAVVDETDYEVEHDVVDWREAPRRDVRSDRPRILIRRNGGQLEIELECEVLCVDSPVEPSPLCCDE